MERKQNEQATKQDIAEELARLFEAVSEIARLLDEAGVDKEELEKRIVEDVRATYRARYGFLGR